MATPLLRASRTRSIVFTSINVRPLQGRYFVNGIVVRVGAGVELGILSGGQVTRRTSPCAGTPEAMPQPRATTRVPSLHPLHPRPYAVHPPSSDLTKNLSLPSYKLLTRMPLQGCFIILR